ncbi:hypothetical protein BJ912DRAFT_1061596 [Pholiota molesta]|nr:hypothetical protein BJ912DRAFT_1061596 [Pholiota molesta]
MSHTVNLQTVYAAPLRSVLRKAVAGFNDHSPRLVRLGDFQSLLNVLLRTSGTLLLFDVSTVGSTPGDSQGPREGPWYLEHLTRSVTTAPLSGATTISFPSMRLLRDFGRPTSSGSCMSSHRLPRLPLSEAVHHPLCSGGGLYNHRPRSVMVRNAQGIYIDEHKGLYIPQKPSLPRTPSTSVDAPSLSEMANSMASLVPVRRCAGHVRNQIDSKPCHGLTSSAETSFYASSDSEDKYGMVKVESDDEKWEIKQEKRVAWMSEECCILQLTAY